MWGSVVVSLVQGLCALGVAGEGPVRLGLPVPVERLERGLTLRGEPGAALAWRPLGAMPGVGARGVWVELALVGAQGRVRIGSGTEPSSGELLLETVCAVARDEEVELRRVEHRWPDGSVDRLERRRRLVRDERQDLLPGEAETGLSAEWLARRTRVRVPPRFWRNAGVLPRGPRGSQVDWVERLGRRLVALPEAPGARGRGDYLRGDPLEGDRVVTNLEFDTILGLARLALATGEERIWRRAWTSARHLVDRDLDWRSGLPFRHGMGHRTVRPEPGHVWLRGLLLVGCLYADDDLIEAARSIARSLARHALERPRPRRRFDRLRDEAWPLWELEHYLRFEALPPIVEAADELAERMIARWDPELELLRYGEGDCRGPYHRVRVWLSAGLAAPALRMYADRTGDRRAHEIVASIERRVAALIRAGGPGIPTACVVGPEGSFGVTYKQACGEVFMLLDGLSPAARKRLLPRVRRFLEGVFDPGCDDLATRWTMVARCDFVWG